MPVIGTSIRAVAEMSRKRREIWFTDFHWLAGDTVAKFTVGYLTCNGRLKMKVVDQGDQSEIEAAWDSWGTQVTSNYGCTGLTVGNDYICYLKMEADAAGWSDRASGDWFEFFGPWEQPAKTDPEIEYDMEDTQ